MNTAKLSLKQLNLSGSFDSVLKITGARTLHCLGDSHTAIFRYISRNYFWFHTRFKFCIVQGATAMGLANPKSKTNAFNIFKDYLKTVAINENLLFCLGEVDCGFVIWYRAQKYNYSVREQFDLSLNNYLEFISHAKQQGFKNFYFCSTPLPTIVDGQNVGSVAELRQEVTATLQERTKLTLEYNQKLRDYSIQEGCSFIDLEKDILDRKTGLIAARFRHPNPLNHHLNEQTIAPLLTSYLKSYGYW
jgi:hypothetical protein